MSWILFGKPKDESPKFLKEVGDYLDPVEKWQRLRKYKSLGEIREGCVLLNNIVTQTRWKSGFTVLLESIRSFDKETLRNIPKPREPVTFLERLKNSIELEIVSNRITTIGYDPEFSYTEEEYCFSYNKLITRKVYTEQAMMSRVNVGLMSVSLLTLLATNFSNNIPTNLCWGMLISSAINYYRNVTYRVEEVY